MSERDDDWSLEDILARFREGVQEELHTALPGRVESYNAGEQVADIKPLVRASIRNASGTFTREEMPVLRAVPVVWPRTGEWFVHMPIAVGDTVLLVVCERDPARWRVTGDVADPIDRRHHHLSHAVAVPGLFSRSAKLASGNTPSDAMVLGNTSGAQLRVQSNGTVVIDANEVQVAGTTALALGPSVEAHLDAISSDLIAIATAAGTTAANYGAIAKPLLDTSNPIAAQKAKGA